MKSTGKISEEICIAVRGILKNARLAAGLSKTALAEKAGLNRMAITFIENGDRTPSIETFIRLAAGLGLNASSLIAQAEKETENNAGLSG